MATSLHRFEITRFVLEDAAIHLEVDKNGKPNWTFAPTAPPGASNSIAASGGQKREDISLANVRLANGLVTYSDARSGATQELSNISATFSLPNLDAPLKVTGKATYKNEELAIDVSAGKTRVLIEGGTTDLVASVSGDLMNAGFNGQGTFGQAFSLSGDAKLGTPSLRKLSAWLAKPMSGSTGFGALSISGKVAADAKHATFDNAQVNLDGSDLAGSIAVDLTAARARLTGNLASNKLDLRPYTGGSDKSGDGTGGSNSAKPPSSGWSTQPIDASALRSFDAAFNVSAGQILIRDLKIGKSALAVTVNGGVLTADLKQLSLYSGSGRGKLTIDGRAVPSTIASTMSLSGLDLGSFMHDAGKTDRFQGTGNFDVDLKGSGHSQAELVSDLNGTTKLAFANGAIKGVDLNAIASVVQTITGKGVADTAAQTPSTTVSDGTSGNATSFASMGANFTVANGVMTTSDFSLVSNVLTLSGGGTIDLTHMTIDFRINPGRDQKNGGLKVAMHVSGPLGHPKISADASSLLRGEVQKRLGDSPAGQLLNGLLGGGQPAGQADQGQQKPKMKDLLHGLFGGGKAKDGQPAQN